MLEHNIMGEWFNEKTPPIPLEKYQTLRAEVQIAFPFKAENLSQSNWDKYKTDRFDMKHDLICEALGQFKSLGLIATTYSPNLDDDIKYG